LFGNVIAGNATWLWTFGLAVRWAPFVVAFSGVEVPEKKKLRPGGE